MLLAALAAGCVRSGVATFSGASGGSTSSGGELAASRGGSAATIGSSSYGEAASSSRTAGRGASSTGASQGSQAGGGGSTGTAATSGSSGGAGGSAGTSGGTGTSRGAGSSSGAASNSSTGDGGAPGTASSGGSAGSTAGTSGGSGEASGSGGSTGGCAATPAPAGGSCNSGCDCVSGACLGGICYPIYPSGVFQQPLPASPHVASNSSAIVQYYVKNWSLAGPSNGRWNVGMHPLVDPISTAEGDDNLTAIYFAKAADPLFTLDCFESWGCPGLQGLQLRIPSNAQWQDYPDMNGPGPTRGNGGDDHLEVISPDGSTEVDLYEASQCFNGAGGKGVCLVGSASTAAIAQSDGFAAGSVATATGWMVSQGMLLPEELLAGRIDHALAIEFPCHDGSFVYPATASDGPSGACPNTSNVLTEGQRVFFTASDATIDGWNVPAYTKIIAKALAHYGAYYGDNQGYGGATLLTINRGSYAAPGVLTDLWPEVATAFGGIPRTGVDSSYDMGFDQIPGGWTSWLAVCDRTGC
ncbi:MAG: hypothetical protein ACYDCL_07435 [Myxococcales bacterium]